MTLIQVGLKESELHNLGTFSGATDRIVALIDEGSLLRYIGGPQKIREGPRCGCGLVPMALGSAESRITVCRDADGVDLVDFVQYAEGLSRWAPLWLSSAPASSR